MCLLCILPALLIQGCGSGDEKRQEPEGGAGQETMDESSGGAGEIREDAGYYSLFIVGEKLILSEERERKEE